MTPAYPRPVPGDYHPYHQRYLDLVPAGETDALACLRRQGLAIMDGFKKLDEQAGNHRYAPGTGRG